MFHDLLAHIKFFGRIGRERIRARQVDQVELVTLEFGHALLGVNRHTTIITHALVCARGKVEERRLAAVGVAYQRHIYFAAPSQGLTLRFQVGWQVILVFIVGQRQLVPRGRRLRLCLHFPLFHHLNLFRLAVT